MEWTGCTASLHLMHKLLSEARRGRDRYACTRHADVLRHPSPESRRCGAWARAASLHPVECASLSARPSRTMVCASRISTATAVFSTCGSRIRTAPGGHPDEPRLLVRRDPVDDAGTGRVLQVAPGGQDQRIRRRHVPTRRSTAGLDLNRNFPQEWEPEGASRAPDRSRRPSPRCARSCEAVVARPNIPGTSRTTP